MVFKHKYFRFAWLLFGAALALIGFEEIIDDVFYDPLEGDHEASNFDRWIADQFLLLRAAKVTQAMIDLTALGSVSVILTLFIVMASILASFRDFKGLIYLFVVLVGAGLWPSILKGIFGRERPLTEHLVKVSDLSFPSGHAFGATAVYIALAFYGAQYTRNWRHEAFLYVLCAILIFLVGVSRIYLGVHFPTDVLAGICAGATWTFLVSAVYEWFIPFRRRGTTNK